MSVETLNLHLKSNLRLNADKGKHQKYTNKPEAKCERHGEQAVDITVIIRIQDTNLCGILFETKWSWEDEVCGENKRFNSNQ
jgi:hypothetical protein